MEETKVRSDKYKKKQGIKKWWQKVKEEQTQIVDHSDSIRILINSIEYHIKERNNCIAFTSYLEEQGKTYIIRRLGEGLAKANYKTLIIDCNVVKPTLSRQEIGEQAENIKGFLDFIALEQEHTVTYDEMQSYIRNIDHEKLYFMPLRGLLRQDDKQYIRKETVVKLLSSLKTQYDVILIETPSVQSLSYMQTLVNASDGYFLIIKAGTVAKNQIGHIKERIKQITTKNIGVILNKSQDIYKERGNDEEGQSI